jgi:hypothetical protein
VTCQLIMTLLQIIEEMTSPGYAVSSSSYNSLPAALIVLGTGFTALVVILYYFEKMRG